MLARLRSALVAASLLLPVTTAVPAFAQPADPALAAAEELFQIMSGEMVDQMVEPAVQQIWLQMESALPPQVDAATRDLLRAEIEAFMREIVGDSMAQGPAIYARYFSEQELRDLIVFYQTPLGGRLLEELPLITNEINMMMLSQLEEMAADLQNRLGRILASAGIN